VPDDDVAAMLAAWRTDLAEPAPADHPPLRKPLRREVKVRAAIAAAAAVVGLAGGLTIAASDADPGSPLWPITRLVYDDRADSRVAEQDARRAIASARQAIADARYTDAGRHLDEATVLIERIQEGIVARSLRDEVAALRGLLPADVPGPDRSPSAPAGGAPSPVAPPGVAPGQSGGPGADPTPTAGDLLPGLPLPSLPLPPLPPLPSLPIGY
jgi:hypothetical protein